MKTKTPTQMKMKSRHHLQACLINFLVTRREKGGGREAVKWKVKNV